MSITFGAHSFFFPSKFNAICFIFLCIVDSLLPFSAAGLSISYINRFFHFKLCCSSTYMPCCSILPFCFIFCHLSRWIGICTCAHFGLSFSLLLYYFVVIEAYNSLSVMHVHFSSRCSPFVYQIPLVLCVVCRLFVVRLMQFLLKFSIPMLVGNAFAVVCLFCVLNFFSSSNLPMTWVRLFRCFCRFTFKT